MLMSTPVSILFATYRAKYAFDFGVYRPTVDPELVSDRSRLAALYAGGGLGATGLALRGVPTSFTEQVGKNLVKSAPLAALATLGAGVAMDKSLADTDPVRVGAGVGLAGLGAGLTVRGLEKSLGRVLRPGAGTLLLKASPWMALAAGGAAYARRREDDFGKIF